MNNPLFQAICRTGIFMICAQAIVQFRPHESYEKYLKLLVGVMILIQLFLPIGRLFMGSEWMEVDALLASFRENLEQEMEEARRQAQEADALLQQMTLEEVRRRMEEQEAVSGKGEDVEETAKEEDVKGDAREMGVEETAKREGVKGDAKEMDVEGTAKGEDVEENVKGESEEENAKEEGEESVSGADDETAGGRVIVEVEPIAPILGEQTGGMQGDGEQVE